ncbi:MAG: HNH endonuclease [Candidatus Nomurabacteria bacterium]|nr:HNH endonuclease [Candidatus Nomurabacteria bacterium]USN88004.1 MAG: HNH endonuclease [Candidatus Nomurabacteria bacterium]
MSFCIEFIYGVVDNGRARFKDVFVYAKNIPAYMEDVMAIGMDSFGENSIALFRTIGDESVAFMKETKMAYRLVVYRGRFSGGIDLFTEAGEMLCRGTKAQLENFMNVYRLSRATKKRYIREIIRELEDEGWLFDVEKAREYLGLEIKASKRGFAPDYTSLAETIYLEEPVIYQGESFFAKIKIKMSGIRSVDDELANAAADLAKKPEGYTWHHLDDFDPVTGECTMQLVSEKVHMKIITLPDGSKVKLLDYLSHLGSPALWSRFYNFGSYGKYIDDITKLFK